MVVIPSSSRTILIVDDDAVIRSTLADLLTDEGYCVACAEDGRAALECLDRGESPGLILLDLMMPVMDGWDFRSEQRRRGTLASVPIVIMTAGGRCPDAAVALEAQGCVGKPFSFQELLAAVKRHIHAPES
jgi:CheY-like chemotaxis protein